MKSGDTAAHDGGRGQKSPENNGRTSTTLLKNFSLQARRDKAMCSMN